MTRSIHQPVSGDVFDEWRVSGNYTWLGYWYAFFELEDGAVENSSVDLSCSRHFYASTLIPLYDLIQVVISSSWPIDQVQTVNSVAYSHTESTVRPHLLDMLNGFSYGGVLVITRTRNTDNVPLTSHYKVTRWELTSDDVYNRCWHQRDKFTI